MVKWAKTTKVSFWVGQSKFCKGDRISATHLSLCSTPKWLQNPWHRHQNPPYGGGSGQVKGGIFFLFERSGGHL